MLTLEECQKLPGGVRVLVTWDHAYSQEERQYLCTWRGGLLWAVNDHGVAERVICWSADAKHDEVLKHKVRLA